MSSENGSVKPPIQQTISDTAVKIPYGRTIEQEIEFRKVEIRITEREAALEVEPGMWDRQLTRLEVELHRLEKEQKRRRDEAHTAWVEELRRTEGAVERLKVHLKKPGNSSERNRQIEMKIKRLQRKLKKGKKK